MVDGFADGTWNPGDVTRQAYRAACGAGEGAVLDRRPRDRAASQVLDEVYAGIGVSDRGRKAAILSAAAA